MKMTMQEAVRMYRAKTGRKHATATEVITLAMKEEAKHARILARFKRLDGGVAR